MQTYDVAVIGAGIMGSAALYALRGQGLNAIAFDPRLPNEKRGSSHGTCRVFRRNNFENPAYTDLSDAACRAWSELEASSGEIVLLPSKVVEAGVPGSTIVAKSRAAAGPDVPGPKRGSDLNALYPAFNLPNDWDVVVQDGGGILRADVALGLFQRKVATRIVRQAARFRATPSDLVVTTSDGTAYAVGKIIVAAGPWVTSLVPGLVKHTTVTRQVVGWFKPSEPARVRYRPNGQGDSFPLFLLDAPGALIYGFPNFEGKGVKAAAHDHGQCLKHADQMDPQVTDEELASVAATLSRYVPAAAGTIISKEACLYTNTGIGDANGSDAEEFILDRIPDNPRVIVASPCSGHGFKFASAIGEMLARMVTDDSYSPGPAFSIRRFSSFC